MKKLSIIIAFVFCTVISFAQFASNPQGTPQQVTQFRGAVTGLRGIMITPNDTLNSPATPYFGALTVLPSDAGKDTITIWVSNGLHWVRFSGGTAFSINDTIYTRAPIAVDKITLPGKQIIYLLHADGLVSGGIITQEGCLTIGVTAPIYFKNYRQYTAAAVFGLTALPIAAPDPTLDRIDLVVADTNLNILVITGTPALLPQPPQYNTFSQVVLGQVPVAGGLTCLGFVTEVIYDQNTEWTITTTGTISQNPDNTDQPYHLTKADYIVTYTNGSQIIFTKPSGVDTVQAGEIIKMFPYLFGPFSNLISGQWYNGATAVSNSILLNPYFNSTDTNHYQQLVAPLSAWNFSNTAGYPQFNKLVLTFGGEDVSGAKGLYLDYIQLQTGIINIATSLQLTTIGSSGAATLIDNVLNIPIYSGGSGGVSKVFAGYGLQNVNDSTLKLDTTIHASSSISGVLSNNDWVNFDSAYVSTTATNDTTLNFRRLNGTSTNIIIRGAGSPDSAIWKNSATYTSGNKVLTMAGNSQSFRGSVVNFDSTTTGTNYNRIGLLLNENFNTGGFPADWSNGGLSISMAGAKATITGAAALGAPASGFPFLPYTSGLQFNTKRMPYEKQDFQMTVVPTTKSAGAVVGMATGTLGFSITSEAGIFWDLSNGTNSGRVSLTSTGGTIAIPSFTSTIDSTSKMSFSTGDTLVLYYKKNGWSVVAGIINKTTGKITAANFNQRWNSSGGLMNLVFLNGTYVLTNAKLNVLGTSGKVLFIGDSQTDGDGNSQESRRFADLIFGANHKYYTVLGLPSLSARYFDTSGIITEIINDIAPTKVIVAFGYNDESESLSAGGSIWSFLAPQTKMYVDSIVYPLQRAGIQVGIMGIVPRTSATTDIWNDSLQSLAAQRGCDFYDIRTLLKTSTGVLNAAYSTDVHLNDQGAVVVAGAVMAKSGDSLLAELAADTNYVVKMYGLPNANTSTVVNLVGLSKNGSAVVVPNTLPTLAGWIQNQYTLTPTAGAAQPSSQVYVSGAVKTDSAFQAFGSNGLRIGFNDNNTSNSTHANIDITNGGGISGGAGVPQGYDSISGSGNVKIIASSTNKPKATMAGTISGDNNTLINSHLTSALSGTGNTAVGSYNFLVTSGSNNIVMGVGGGRGITTGSKNIDFDFLGDGTTTNTSNTIFEGSNAHAFNNDIKQSGDIGWALYGVAPNFWFGGRASKTAVVMNSTASYGTNITGNLWTFRGARGTGLASGGNILFQTSVLTTTGSTLHSTFDGKLFMDQFGVGIGAGITTHATDLVVDAPSTVGGFAPPRMTTTQRDLLQTGVLTLATNAVGSGATDGTAVITFTGGGGSGATGYCTVLGGAVQNGTAVLTSRGTGYTSVPSASIATGSGSTFTVTIGATTANTIFNTTTGQYNFWNGTAWIPLGGTSNYAHTIFTPTTGQTISLINNQYNIVNPAGALLALTVNMPSTPSNNDVVYLKFTQAVTTVTYANGTVADGIASPIAGGLVILTYDTGTTTWY